MSQSATASNRANGPPRTLRRLQPSSAVMQYGQMFGTSSPTTPRLGGAGGVFEQKDPGAVAYFWTKLELTRRESEGACTWTNKIADRAATCDVGDGRSVRKTCIDLYDITSSHLFPRCTSDVHPLERCSIRFTPQIANSDWTVAEARSKLGSHRFWIDQLVPAVASAFGVEHTVDGLAHDLTVHLVGPESIVYATARALQLLLEHVLFTNADNPFAATTVALACLHRFALHRLTSPCTYADERAVALNLVREQLKGKMAPNVLTTTTTYDDSLAFGSKTASLAWHAKGLEATARSRPQPSTPPRRHRLSRFPSADNVQAAQRSNAALSTSPFSSPTISIFTLPSRSSTTATSFPTSAPHALTSSPTASSPSPTPTSPSAPSTSLVSPSLASSSSTPPTFPQSPSSFVSHQRTSSLFGSPRTPTVPTVIEEAAESLSDDPDADLRQSKLEASVEIVESDVETVQEAEQRAKKRAGPASSPSPSKKRKSGAPSNTLGLTIDSSAPKVLPEFTADSKHVAEGVDPTEWVNDYAGMMGVTRAHGELVRPGTKEFVVANLDGKPLASDDAPMLLFKMNVPPSQSIPAGTIFYGAAPETEEQPFRIQSGTKGSWQNQSIVIDMLKDTEKLAWHVFSTSERTKQAAGTFLKDWTEKDAGKRGIIVGSHQVGSLLLSTIEDLNEQLARLTPDNATPSSLALLPTATMGGFHSYHRKDLHASNSTTYSIHLGSDNLSTNGMGLYSSIASCESSLTIKAPIQSTFVHQVTSAEDAHIAEYKSHSMYDKPSRAVLHTPAQLAKEDPAVKAASRAAERAKEEARRAADEAERRIRNELPDSDRRLKTGQCDPAKRAPSQQGELSVQDLTPSRMLRANGDFCLVVNAKSEAEKVEKDARYERGYLFCMTCLCWYGYRIFRTKIWTDEADAEDDDSAPVQASADTSQQTKYQICRTSHPAPRPTACPGIIRLPVGGYFFKRSQIEEEKLADESVEDVLRKWSKEILEMGAFFANGDGVEKYLVGAVYAFYTTIKKNIVGIYAIQQAFSSFMTPFTAHPQYAYITGGSTRKIGRLMYQSLGPEVYIGEKRSDHLIPGDRNCSTVLLAGKFKEVLAYVAKGS